MATRRRTTSRLLSLSFLLLLLLLLLLSLPLLLRLQLFAAAGAVVTAALIAIATVLFRLLQPYVNCFCCCMFECSLSDKLCQRSPPFC